MWKRKQLLWWLGLLHHQVWASKPNRATVWETGPFLENVYYTFNVLPTYSYRTRLLVCRPLLMDLQTEWFMPVILPTLFCCVHFGLSYDHFWLPLIAGPSLNLPPHLCMWSDQSEAQTGRQQMRTEVDEKIKVESNISILNPVCVCIFDKFPSDSTSRHHWSWSGREIREKRVTSEGMQRRKGQKKKKKRRKYWDVAMLGAFLYRLISWAWEERDDQHSRWLSHRERET